MTALLLGIDLGTTMLKMAVFDRGSGELECAARRSLRVNTADAGAEIPLEVLDQALSGCVEELRRALGGAWGDVTGVGLGAQGGSNIIVARDTGAACTPMYLWNDGRCHEALRRLGAKQSPAYWQEKLGYAVPPTGLGRMMWMREQRPELFGDRYLHVGAGEYVFHQLTGVWRQDAGNAIQIGSYLPVKDALDPEVLALADVPLSFVAPLRQGHETSPLSVGGASRFGLREGIPVAGPYLDQEAGYLSVGSRSRVLHCSLGTAWVGNFIVAREDPWTSKTHMMLPSTVGGDWFIVQPLPTGNSAWDWALESFLGAVGEERFGVAKELFRKQLLPPPGLTVLPWHAQGNPLLPEYTGGGAVLGLRADTPREDLLRAVAVGLVCEFYRNLGPLCEHGLIDEIVVGGGASEGAQFRTLIAAMFAPTSVSLEVEHDLDVARGALHVFRTPASHAAKQAVSPPDADTVCAVKETYGRYARVFERVYGPSPEGDGFML